MERVRSGAYALLFVGSRNSDVTALPLSGILSAAVMICRHSGGAVLPHSTALAPAKRFPFALAPL